MGELSFPPDRGQTSAGAALPDVQPQLVRDAVVYADRWLAYRRRLQEIPAETFAVWHGTELIHSSAHGYANLEEQIPATPQHVFRVASHSKWFTGVALMQLKERGKVRLDEPLGLYLTWLPDPLDRVTIRAVLNHAGGITRDGYDNDHWQLTRAFPDLAQLRRLVEEGGSVLPANRCLKYSNIGYSLLGLVIEQAAGVPYNTYVRENIVERLDLTNTGPETDQRARSRLVTGYTARGLLIPRLPVPDVETGAMSAATGFYSTAEDLARFAAAQFPGDDSLLSDESKREMQRPYWPVTEIDSYGLGMQVSKIGTRWLAGHSGGFPGHSTRTLLDPELRLAVSLLTNESAGSASDLVKSVVKLIDLALAQRPVPEDFSLDRFAGRFVSWSGYTDIFRLGGQLFLVEPSEDDPAAEVVRLDVTGPDTLRIEDKEGYGSPGEDIQYLYDRSGALAKVIIAGSTHYPENAKEQVLRRDAIAFTSP